MKIDFSRLPSERVEIPEEWRPVPGMDYMRYEVSNRGNLRRPIQRGYKVLKPYVRQVDGLREFQFMTAPHQSKHMLMARLVWRVFRGEPKAGECVIHKGLHTDDSMDNLMLVTKAQCGTRLGARSSKRKPVLKVNGRGEILEVFPSCRQAAFAMHMSASTMFSRIQRGIWMPNGVKFVWEEDYEEELEK